MATSPNIPQRRQETEHAKVQMIRQSKFPWLIVILIAGAALLLAIFALLPKAPRMTAPPTGAQVPQQPTADQVQLTNLKLAPAPTGGAAYMTAILHNTGGAADGTGPAASVLGHSVR